jgi:hypothetical protein
MPNFFVSSATVITIVIGTIIAFVYLRYMWLTLQRTARTLDDPDDEESDAFGFSFLGAIIAVVASSLSIVAYGLAPQLLYLGILLALASPIAVAYTFWRELND